nr:MAG TPA: hypothetical protein [Bacteriophage sp.]
MGYVSRSYVVRGRVVYYKTPPLGYSRKIKKF